MVVPVIPDILKILVGFRCEFNSFHQQVPDPFAQTLQSQFFFASISCSMALSRLRSATHACRHSCVSSFLPAHPHGLIEAQTGNQLLQSEILFLKLPHVFQLRRRNPPVFLAPCIERGIGNTQLTADFRHGRPSSACFRAKIICSSVNRDFFIGTTSVQGV